MLKEAKSSVMNFTGKVLFTLPVKFITLDAASLSVFAQKMHKAGIILKTFPRGKRRRRERF
jgi:hypothetical protein